jgi:hypothetical protein
MLEDDKDAGDIAWRNALGESAFGILSVVAYFIMSWCMGDPFADGFISVEIQFRASCNKTS